MKTTKKQRSEMRDALNAGGGTSDFDDIGPSVSDVLSLLDDLDEMECNHDEWKRSAETVATERDHAIRRLQDASDIGKRHAMAEANESANLRVASVIRELRDEIAEAQALYERAMQFRTEHTTEVATYEAFTAADLWTTAYRQHLAGIGARLCPRVPFEKCDSPPCAKWRAAAR